MDSNNDSNNPNNKDLSSQEPRKATQDSLPLNQGTSFETGSPTKHDALFGGSAKQDDDLTSFDDDNWDNNDFESDFNDSDFKDEFDDEKEAPSSRVINQSGDSFLKKNFHFVAIGAVAIVGGYLVYSTLFASSDQPAYVGYKDMVKQQQTSTAQDANNPFNVSGGQGAVDPTEANTPEGTPLGANDVGLLMGGEVTSQTIQTQVLSDGSTEGLVPPSDWNTQQPPMPAPIANDTTAPALEGSDRQVIGVPVTPVVPSPVTPDTTTATLDSSLPATSAEDEETILLTNQPPAAENLNGIREIQATGSDPVAEILAPAEDELKALTTPTTEAPALKDLMVAEAPVTPEVTPKVTPEVKAEGVAPTVDAPKKEAMLGATPSPTAPVEPTPTGTYVENEQIEFLRQNLANAENRIKSLDNRFETIINQLDTLNQKVSLLQAGSPVPASLNQSETQELKNQIKELEKEVKDAKASASNSETKPSFPRTDAQSTEKKAEKPKAAPKKKAKKETKPDTKKVVQKPSVEIQQPVATPSRWVLRAAQPNVAWVSQGIDSPIQKVTVGETLSSVGRVQSITMENGRWVVRGSESAIFQ